MTRELLTLNWEEVLGNFTFRYLCRFFPFSYLIGIDHVDHVINTLPFHDLGYNIQNTIEIRIYKYDNRCENEHLFTLYK
jgi:hypothetical protein